MRFLADSLIGLALLGLLIGVLLYHRKQQRLMVDALIGLLLVGVLASVILYRREQHQKNERYEAVVKALDRLHDQAEYHGVLAVRQTGRTGFPSVMSPLWFRSGLPMNVAVPGWHPWLDIAPPGDMSIHPPDPIITEQVQAGFWYNPNKGVFRARVERQWSESATLSLYNRLNQTQLLAMPISASANRQPISLWAAAKLSTEIGNDLSTDDNADGTPKGRSLMAAPNY